GSLHLWDISLDGRFLVNKASERVRAQFDAGEGCLSWACRDWTLLRGFARDGSRVLFDETGIGGGHLSCAYIRHTSGAPAVRLGDGLGFSLSPDAQWALVGVGHSPSRLDVLPCGAGEPRTIPSGARDMHDGS